MRELLSVGPYIIRYRVVRDAIVILRFATACGDRQSLDGPWDAVERR
jgi:hypothetical protein